MTARLYAVESALYRTAGLMEGFIEAKRTSPEDVSTLLAVGEEYAVEASILKVAGSEMVDFLIDEEIQIHGGNGFVRDYPAERAYRDARVNRIFEGTNEINRLLIPGMLLRRALKGELPILKAAKAIQDELMAPPAAAPRAGGGPLVDEQSAVAGFKKAALAVMGVAMLKFGEKLAEEQEVMMSIADMIIEVFLAESAVLRAMAARTGARPNADLHEDAARVYVNDAAGRVEASAKQALAAMAEGDMLRTHLAALRRLMKWTPVNTVVMRRRLADATVTKSAYLFR
jgi:alkylation response protein AidB-like acyl-CoA dehydrogenase